MSSGTDGVYEAESANHLVTSGAGNVGGEEKSEAFADMPEPMLPLLSELSIPNGCDVTWATFNDFR